MGRKIKRRKQPKTLSGIRRHIQEEIEQVNAQNDRKIRRKRGGITGVAAGWADYFNIDPTWMRLGLVIGTIFTSGALLIPYAIMAFVLPKEGEGPLYDTYQIEYGEDWPMFTDELPEASETRQVCWKCDTVTRPNAKYCPHCGAKL